MKTIKAILTAAFLAAYVVWTLASCTTTTIRTVTTDKAGAVTDTTVTRKGSDPAALALVNVAASIYLPRPAMMVREEKFAPPSELRRILKSNPITREEIANRYRKP